MKKRSTIMAIVLACIFIASTASAGRLWTTKDGYPAAIYKSDLEKAISYSVSKDKAAFMKLFNQGRFIILKPGIKVYIVTTSGLGKVKIRPQGETIEFWTLSEAIY